MVFFEVVVHFTDIDFTISACYDGYKYKQCNSKKSFLVYLS